MVIAHQTHGQLAFSMHFVMERVPRSPGQSAVAQVVPWFVQHLETQVTGDGSLPEGGFKVKERQREPGHTASHGKDRTLILRVSRNAGRG